MDLQVGVKVFLRNQEGKFLILQRSAIKYPEVVERWDIVGGRIEAGTPLLDNLKREIMEETGLTLTSVPTLIAAQDILRIPGRHVVRLSYVATIDGVPTIDEEHDAYQWLTINELRDFVGFDSHAKSILDLVK